MSIAARHPLVSSVCICVIELVLLNLAWSPRLRGQGPPNCQSPANAIVAENCQAGNPASEWDVSGSGASSIQGFATDISVNRAQTISFKVNTPATSYRLDIYRMGYYGGLGARKVATILPSISLPQTQPSCLQNGATGLVDCGNWAVSASWNVPATATSGIYFARAVREDMAPPAPASHIFFVVRDDDGHSDLLFQTSDTTWQAYNTYGGNSLYVGSPAGRAYKVSYNRPFNTRDHDAQSFVFNAEYPMVRWLEANGYNVSYFSGLDTSRLGGELLEHKVFLSVGHDEYWSATQRTNVEAARGAGVHLAFLSGNEVFWKTRWEASIDPSATPNRTLVSYKETHANAKIDPSPEWTGTWRDPRFSPPADGGRPENGLTGTIFAVNGYESRSIVVPEAQGKLRLWRNTTAAALSPGGSVTFAAGTLGYEWDTDADNGFRPAGLFDLSTASYTVPAELKDYGTTYGTGSVTHHVTMYRHGSGARVFGAGTVQWSWGLDPSHDFSGAPSNVDMKQATVNLFADMGVQPGSLTTGLVPASASTDTLAPTSSVVSTPAVVEAGIPATVSGTASDTGGSVVAGVEVSVDGGATWHAAVGTAQWSYSWTPATNTSIVARSRAVDDSGNIETPGVGVPINSCPCSIWNNGTVPGTPADQYTGPIELGVKFRSEVGGYITGLRFYKGTINTGAHVASLWTTGGTLLATATLTNETASGWQQVSLDSPVAIAPNSTLVASYHTDAGHYAKDENYFATSSFVNRPLRALANGLDGPNGVYKEGASGFPNLTFNSTNYWVDVVFVTTLGADTTPPTVTNVVPAAGAANIDASANITATFSESIDASSITTATFELRDSSNALVPAAVSYDNATRTATLHPSAVLANSATFTGTIKGGAPGVRDLAGNPLAANFTWSFTTRAPGICPCSIWNLSTTPTTPSNADPNAIELGVRFRSQVGGRITGLRFYKGAQNTGTHIGHLWTNTGTLLASATYTNETTTGWQRVTLATPVTIAANTTYVASYFTPTGNYAVDRPYFDVTRHLNAPLEALKDGQDGANGVFLYVAAPGAFPTGTFQSTNYWVDVEFETATGNTAPVAANDSFSTNEDTALNVAAPGVLGNDTDVDGNPLTAVLVSGPLPAQGTLTLNANGSFGFTPALNFNGPATFTYKANDGSLDSNTATVTITVNPVNDAPVAVNNSYSTNEDTALNVAAPGVLGNDTDVDGNPLTAVLVSGPLPAQGTLTLNANGSFAFTPALNFNGPATFTYKANDGSLDSNTATVTITITAVNDAPAAANDSYGVTAGATLNVAASGVLGNDMDADGNPLTVVQVTGPAKGTLTLNANGSFTYGSNTGSNGTDTFTYKANDGGLDSAPATVTITIAAGNNAPVAANDSFSTNEDTALNVAAPGVLGNDTDAEGNPLTAVLVNGPLPAQGTLTLNTNGSFTFTPALNFNGPATFTYKANDGSLDSNTATVTITINPVNDAPIATGDSYNVTAGTTLNVAAPGVLDNDTDVEGSPLTAVQVTGPTKGTLTLNANGSFTYVSNGGSSGTDTFIYKANDGGLDAAPATVTITIAPGNSAPVVASDSYTTNEDTALNVAAPGVLGNDTDADGNPLTAALVSAPLPAQGTLTLNANGSFAFTPALNFNGSATFTYKANDGSVDSNPATVTITVNPVNDAPVAVNNSYTTNEDTALNVAAPGVLGNDTDVEGNPLTAVLVSGPLPAQGTLTLNANGSFAFTPALNFNGPATFTYKANDGSLDSNNATVTVTVNAVNDAPIATSDSYNVTTGATLNVAAPGVLVNDTDAEGSPLTAAQVTAPTKGTLTLNANGSLTYVSTAGSSGTDTFTYKANDGGLDSPPAMVTITIAGGNSAPVAAADSYSTNEDTALNVAAPSVLGNDTDADGNPLTAVLVSGPLPAQGTLTLNANGSFGFTPALNFNGPATFTYKANDGSFDSNTATVTVTVNPVNDAPTTSDITDQTTAEDTATASLPFTVGDIDTALTSLTVTGTSSNTTLVPNANIVFGGAGANRTVKVTPAVDQNGTATITVRVNDGGGVTAVDTFVLRVTEVNDPPIAAPDSKTAAEDAALSFAASDLLANDTSGPANEIPTGLVAAYNFDEGAGTLVGDVSGTGNTGTIFGASWTTAGKFGQALSFDGINDWVTVADAASLDLTTGMTIEAWVYPTATSPWETVALKEAPMGLAYSLYAREGAARPAAYIHTSADVASAGTTALPVNAWTHLAATYDGAALRVFVNGTQVRNTAVTGPMMASADPLRFGGNNVWGEWFAGRLDEIRVYNRALNASAIQLDMNTPVAETARVTAVTATAATHGTAALAGGIVTYQPTANFNGAATFEYTLCDSGITNGVPDNKCVPGTVNVTVTAVSDAPIATGDNYNVTAGATLNVAAPGVLTNDTDVEGSPLTAVQVTGPTKGTLTLNANGSFTYVSTAGSSGTDTFTYKANDGSLDSNTATVTITIAGGNSAPVASNDSYSTNEDTALNVAAPGVLGNDTDAAGNPLTAVLVGGPLPALGTLTLNANGSFVFAPALNFSGPATFTYRANDGSLDSNTATVTITVNPVNDAPIGTGDSYNVTAGTTLNVAAPGVLANDTDVEGSPLTAVQVTGPTKGTLTLNANGSFTYASNTGSSGTDTFTYKANDGGLDAAPATVTITIAPGNSAPVVASDSYSTNEDTALNVAAPGVLGNDTDADGNPLTAVLVSAPLPAQGTLTLNANGSFVFTPALNFNGPATFTYKANDGSLESNPATVTITVNPVNDAPVVNAGPDVTTTLPAPATLAGTASDIDSGVASILWSKVTGPGTVTFANASSPSTTAIFSAAGQYVLSLNAGDGELSVSDTAVVNVGAGNMALQFDGVSRRVTFGAAPGLGASTFTIETWFKREGPGLTVSTGTGGVTAIPLVTKGMAQADGSNVDMNYFLGIDGTKRVLTADFEDMATGLNHPAFGTTVICDNIWYHAAATYDGTTWRLYLNGVLETTLVVGTFTPRFDSLQHAGLAGAFTSTGAGSGAFQGMLDEPRIWNVARSASEIQAGMAGPIPSAAGLIGRWSENEGSGSTIADSTGGGNIGTVQNGAVWVDGTPFVPTQLPPGNYGLHLGGTSAAGDYVTFGPAPGLGAATFTIETWFKRDGAGVATSTGNGGVVAIPLVTKGMAETEGGTVDMNYFLGIRSSDNVLVADFEDTATGLNHPVAGMMAIPADGTWRHVAATYDGTTWRLYLNGALEATLVVGNFTPRFDSIQHAALGTALNSTGGVGSQTQGFFAGTLDESRVWNYARSASQILAGRGQEIATASGLLGRWGFNDGCAVCNDSSGNGQKGTLQGTGWSWVAGAPISSTPNLPPTVNAGVDQAVTLPAAVPLNGTVSDDGVPGGPVTTLWTKKSGPGTVTFGDAAARGTTANLSASGMYVLTLTADDGLVTSSDDIVITATGVSNQAPVVNAGPDAPITLPANVAALSGSVTDDGAPGTGVTSLWTKVSGPAAVTFANAAAAATTVKFSIEGTYVLQLTGSDGLLSSIDTVTITVNPNAANKAIRSGGTNAYVTFGPAPGLGAATFTIETWFRRDTAGVATNTGTGGVVAVPLVTKGMAETEGGTVDMNYFLGIRQSDSVLVADFEDMATGLNHPVSGTTAIPADGTWHHVAVSYDGTTWRLYLDGGLQTTLVVGSFTPRFNSIQHAALGTALNSTGGVGTQTQGFFGGVLDEARVWNYARSLAEIQSGRYQEILTATGLLGRWGLNEGNGATVADSSGHGISGTVVGTDLSWVTGAPFVTTP